MDNANMIKLQTRNDYEETVLILTNEQVDLLKYLFTHGWLQGDVKHTEIAINNVIDLT